MVNPVGLAPTVLSFDKTKLKVWGHRYSAHGSRSGPRFDSPLLTDHDLAGVSEVMDPPTPKADRLEPELAVNAHDVLLLVLPPGNDPRSIGYQPIALPLSYRRMMVPLRRIELRLRPCRGRALPLS